MIYTVKAYKKELNKRLKKLDKAKTIFKCASSAHEKMVTRIFVKGLNSTLQPHGKYSKKPLYVSTQFNSPVTLKGVGKTGETVFKNGKPHKSTYFSGGYKSFKGAINKGTKVNFWLFGKLKNDFTNSLQRKGKKWVAGTKSGDNTTKLNALILKFGADSWMISKKIREEYTACIKRQLDKKLMNVPIRN